MGSPCLTTIVGNFAIGDKNYTICDQARGALRYARNNAKRRNPLPSSSAHHVPQSPEVIHRLEFPVRSFWPPRLLPVPQPRFLLRLARPPSELPWTSGTALRRSPPAAPG